MIDVHCHLNLPGFETDAEEVILRATEAGVTTIINTGTSLETSKKAIHFAETHENMFAIIGIHPIHAHEVPENWLAQLEELIAHPKVVGIGEIGLDYYHSQDPEILSLQKDVLRKQLELAVRVQKPIQIHQRHAGEDTLAIISEYRDRLPQRIGMMHCFAGTIETLEIALDMGFSIGIDGNVTYPGIAKGETVSLTEIVTRTPMDRLVTETDSPFLTPIPLRGSRNEPRNVILVAKQIASIKKRDFDEVAAQTERNARELFMI